MGLAICDTERVLLNVAGRDGEFGAPVVKPFFWVAPMSFGADGEGGEEFGVGRGSGAKGHVIPILR